MMKAHLDNHSKKGNKSNKDDPDVSVKQSIIDLLNSKASHEDVINVGKEKTNKVDTDL